MLLLMSFISVNDEYFPEPIYPIADSDSPIAALGRELFHDPILSKDSTVSCASCHSQYNAFAHSDHALSHGIADRIGTRNAPALVNLAWSESFMWDGASFSLEAQVLTPLTAHHEMDNSLDTIIHRLNKHPKYSNLVQQAFGKSPIQTKHVLKHYAEGINMHDETRNIKSPIPLSSNDITDLMSFLHALTDRTFIFNPSFSQIHYPQRNQ